MAEYPFDPTEHYQRITGFDVPSGSGSRARLTIYGYLGHPLIIEYYKDQTPAFSGYIIGVGPEQYEFYCYIQPELYANYVSVLNCPGQKHVHILADSTIPPEQRPFAIRITQVIISNETFFIPAGPVATRVVPDALRDLIPEEFRSIIESSVRSR